MNLNPMLVGLVFLVAPALMLVFYRTIEGFEQCLNERKLYLAWGGGVIFAVLVTLLELLFGMRLESNLDRDRPALVGLAAQPLLHNMLLLVALNHPRMRVHRENPFYGAGLGLSFGATYGTLVMFEAGREWMTLEELPLLLPALFGLCLFLGAQGAWLGLETFKRDKMTFVARAWGLYTGFTLLRFLWFIGDRLELEESYGWWFKFALGLVMLGVGGLHYRRQYRVNLRAVFVTPPRQRRRRPAPPGGRRRVPRSDQGR